MSNRVGIITGDDVVLLHQIEKTNASTGLVEPFNIPSTATVKSRIISTDHEIAYTDSIQQNENETGADWANSLVAVSFDSDTTNQIVDKVKDNWKNGEISAILETQIDDNGKNTYFARIRIIKGTIA